MDPAKDGLNWYQYCYSNPTTYYDSLGLWGTTTGSIQAQFSGSGYGINVSLEILSGLLRMRETGYYIKDIIHNLTSGTIIAAMQDLGGNSSYGDSPIPGFEIPYYFGKILGHAWTIALVAIITDYGTDMTLGGAAFEESVVSVDKPDQRYTYDEATGTLHRFLMMVMEHGIGVALLIKEKIH